jgi:hypothetical protein
MAKRSNDDFDGYRKWLGIPKDRRPPTFYELLAISLDEDDNEVIRTAVTNRRQIVESRRGEGHDDQVKEILYQITEAEYTLLDDALRRDYDQDLGLFMKRRRNRRVNPFPSHIRVQSRPGPSVGENPDTARTFFYISGTLAVLFCLVALLSFQLPWGVPNRPAAPAVAGNNPPPPVVANGPAANPAAPAEPGPPPEADSPAPRVAAIPAGFRSLFNGVDLTGWHGRAVYDERDLERLGPVERTDLRNRETTAMQAAWSVRNGVLVGTAAAMGPATNDLYGDFEFRGDFLVKPGTAAGILLRGAPQVCLWDADGNGVGGKLGSGALVPGTNDVPQYQSPRVKADRPVGEWNQIAVRVVGGRVFVTLNDKVVIEKAILRHRPPGNLPLSLLGPVQLRVESGGIHWTNLFIRPIGGDEARSLLMADDAGKFQKLFDGRTFAGWKGDIGAHDIRDGAFFCKPGTRGNLVTARDFGNYELRFEFLLPPGGNNGVGLHYPGQGDASQSGLGEVQILDDSAAKYAAIQPSQYTGSLYGMVPAHRGYLRPVGEWNTMEITVLGSNIRVELNGTIVMESHVPSAPAMFNGRPHLGRNRTSGAICFCGHTDPVQFRNVLIKELPGGL